LTLASGAGGLPFVGGRRRLPDRAAGARLLRVAGRAPLRQHDGGLAGAGLVAVALQAHVQRAPDAFAGLGGAARRIADDQQQQHV